MKFVQALIGAPVLDYVPLAVAAEHAGFDAVALSDHVLYPEVLESAYPYAPSGVPQFDPTWDFPDPWVTIGAITGATTTLECLTNVYVLPLRHPLDVVNVVGTASAVSGGRVSLGIGAGWMAEEFDALDQQFAQRGKRMDESLEIIRKAWQGGFFSHSGEFYNIASIDVRPVPHNNHVPIFVGGHSDRALKRAAHHDGWIGVNYSPEVLIGYLEKLRQVREDEGTADRPFEIVASPLAMPEPELVHQLESYGVTHLLTSAWMSYGEMVPKSVDHGVEMLNAYSEQYISPLSV